MTECKVWLDNYHGGYYYPGNQIQGRVVITVSTETKIRKIKLTLKGDEHTEWMGTERTTRHNRHARDRRSRSRTVLKTGNHNFMHTDIILIGNDHSGTITIPAGQHIYPFTLTLPYNIPGTYNGEYGSVSYRLKAVVDRPMAFDYKDSLMFVVATLVDLNASRGLELLEPTSYSKNKTLYCCCWSRGHIEMDVHLPKKSLTPQDNVKVSVRISNLSRNNIESVELKLKQRITCKVDDSSEPNKTISNKLLHVREGGIGSNGQHTYTLPVKLPANTVLPNFSMCKLFKVTYAYSVVAKLPGPHINLKVEMFPELGHIDIGQNLQRDHSYPPISCVEQASTNYGFQGDVSRQPYLISSIDSNNFTMVQSTVDQSDSAPIIENDLPPPYDSVVPPIKD